ncbi:NPP1 family protein [Zooshikella ganghwensis]|uniref:NPP1 family protein n=1 Tax=Zooshikella ganghwensis TaxID=202772 RepID=UPI000424C809|nr:NPP1 family protein [Zooshikella ganghwensis]
MRIKAASYIPVAISVLLVTMTHADDFNKLDQAVPANNIINTQEPVFDFDTDGCLPAAGISRDGRKNPGLKNSGGLAEGCNDNNFLNTSNTLHRYACTSSSKDQFCGHFYALYFEKDQVAAWIDVFGHRHDWEHVAIWTTNGKITHASYSAHGKLYTKPASNVPFEGAHVKFVYHKDGISTHAMRFAKSNEIAENPYGQFVTPTIVSWYELVGDGIANREMRNKLNSFDYGKATIPLKDSNFRTRLNDNRPDGYPLFSEQDIEASNPNHKG